MNKYFYFIIFHLGSTLQFDLMLENELFPFTLFLIWNKLLGTRSARFSNTFQERIVVEHRGTTVFGKLAYLTSNNS